jgi:hypothetical protein
MWLRRARGQYVLLAGLSVASSSATAIGLDQGTHNAEPQLTAERQAPLAFPDFLQLTARGRGLQEDSPSSSPEWPSAILAPHHCALITPGSPLATRHCCHCVCRYQYPTPGSPLKKSFSAGVNPAWDGARAGVWGRYRVLQRAARDSNRPVSCFHAERSEVSLSCGRLKLVAALRMRSASMKATNFLTARSAGFQLSVPGRIRGRRL